MKKLFLAGMLLMGATSCSVDNAVPEFNDTDGIKTLDLAADISKVTHHFGPAGYVEAWTEPGFLYVKFVANSGHQIINSRVEIVEAPSEFPANGGGNLPPGQIGNADLGGGPEDYHEYEFDISLFGDCVYIAPWAIFTKGGSTTEHYAGDILGGNDKKAKWWYFQLGTCDREVQTMCESAYAVLVTYDSDGNPIAATSPTLLSYYPGKPTNVNWGWYNSLYFNNNSRSETFDIYAAAGQNDVKNGFKIGTLEVEYDAVNDIVTVTPHWDYVGITPDSHLFVADGLPSKRPAPGKFTPGKTLSVYELDGNFKMIFHTKACWNVIN